MLDVAILLLFLKHYTSDLSACWTPFSSQVCAWSLRKRSVMRTENLYLFETSIVSHPRVVVAPAVNSSCFGDERLLRTYTLLGGQTHGIEPHFCSVIVGHVIIGQRYHKQSVHSTYSVGSEIRDIHDKYLSREITLIAEFPASEYFLPASSSRLRPQLGFGPSPFVPAWPDIHLPHPARCGAFAEV